MEKFLEMQSCCYTRVVKKLENMNLRVPAEVEAAFREEAGRAGLGRKELWEYVSVAMLLLIESPAAVRAAYRKAVRDADVDGGFADLVGRARTGKLRQQAVESPPPATPGRPKIARVRAGLKEGADANAHPKR
jgi:hypothetical protein